MINHPRSTLPFPPATFSSDGFDAEGQPEIQSLRMPRPGDAGEICAAALAGDSQSMCKLRSQVTRIAPYFRTALVTGLVGTPKVAVARMLHAFSPCGTGEFVACEASALAEAMLGDDGRTVLQSVVGGTLFLEDVGEVPPALQGLLLRLWSGGERGKMRVVAGTHRNLRTMGVTGQFRQDLVQRLTGVELAIPPLSERMEDLPAVLAEGLSQISATARLSLSPDALARLLEHAWPGDVAELEAVLRKGGNAAEGGLLIERNHLPELFADEPAQEGQARTERLQDVVQQHVLGVLTRCGGNKLRASEALGISRSTLYRMLETCIGDAFPRF